MSIEKNYMAKIAKEKSVLKEYTTDSSYRTVYLNNGDEFQICLFNPETYTIGAEISINGNTEDGLIVVRPGERIWIERPLNKQKKYKFETYEVEDSAEAANAIRNNGLVYIRFFKEANKNNNYLIKSPNPYYEINYRNSDSITLSGAKINGITTTNIGDNILLNNVYTSASDCSYCANDQLLHTALTSISCNCENSTNKSIETGRITTGSYSKQNFSATNIEFEFWPFSTESIKILPMSRKPYTSSDLQKIYCSECGRKLKPKYKFCPYCGAKIEQFED